MSKNGFFIKNRELKEAATKELLKFAKSHDDNLIL